MIVYVCLFLVVFVVGCVFTCCFIGVFLRWYFGFGIVNLGGVGFWNVFLLWGSLCCWCWLFCCLIVFWIALHVGHFQVRVDGRYVVQCVCSFALQAVHDMVGFFRWHWLQSSICWYFLVCVVGFVHFLAPSIRNCLVLICIISLLICSLVVVLLDEITFAFMYVLFRFIVCPDILSSFSMYGLPLGFVGFGVFFIFVFFVFLFCFVWSYFLLCQNK